jgi:ketosteroid isomerase-like protein
MGTQAITAQEPTSVNEVEARAIDKQICEAIVNRDTNAIESLLADNYVHINVFGEVATRTEVLAGLESGGISPTKYETNDVNVHLTGGIAVLTGNATLEGKFEGKDLTGPMRFSRTIANLNGRLQILATQFTPIVKT